LLEWFAQSERLNIARIHHHLRGPQFTDFAERIGVDQSSAFQLVKLWQNWKRILRVAQSAVCGHLSMGGECRRLRAGRWHGDRSAAGLVRCPFTKPCRSPRSPCCGGKLSYVGRNGYAPFPSKIVERNPQTVKRQPGKVDIVLDTGQCIGGVYKAA
jgi:hypothetical protein